MEEILDFVVLGLLYALVFYKKWKAKGREQLIINTTMYVYLCFVLYFTLMPIITSLPFIFDHPYVPMNLQPFIDVISQRGNFVKEIILNIIMTIPFGFLLPLTNKKNMNFAKVILWTLLLSLTIEIIQPLISSARFSDITDVITNVTGGAIGYVLYLILKPLVERLLILIRKKKI